MSGVFGNTLAQAKRSEFFVWFHLEETSRKQEGALTVLTFRPTSDQFHDLVAVEMTTDANDGLRAAALVIQRAFIDHTQSFTFAADITKSFLVAALEPADIGLIGEAALQIRGYQPAGSGMRVMYVRNAPEPIAPGEGETEYLTYAGKRRQFQRALETSNLSMVNGQVCGLGHLTIKITPK